MRNGGQQIGGHTGEAFVMQNEAVLAKHPEYLAKVDGKYTPLYLPTKIAAFANYVWDAAANKYVKAAKPGTGTHELNTIAKLNAGNPDGGGTVLQLDHAEVSSGPQAGRADMRG